MVLKFFILLIGVYSFQTLALDCDQAKTELDKFLCSKKCVKVSNIVNPRLDPIFIADWASEMDSLLDVINKLKISLDLKNKLSKDQVSWAGKNQQCLSRPRLDEEKCECLYKTYSQRFAELQGTLLQESPSKVLFGIGSDKAEYVTYATRERFAKGGSAVNLLGRLLGQKEFYVQETHEDFDFDDPLLNEDNFVLIRGNSGAYNLLVTNRGKLSLFSLLADNFNGPSEKSAEDKNFYFERKGEDSHTISPLIDDGGCNRDAKPASCSDLDVNSEDENGGWESDKGIKCRQEVENRIKGLKPILKGIVIDGVAVTGIKPQNLNCNLDDSNGVNIYVAGVESKLVGITKDGRSLVVGFKTLAIEHKIWINLQTSKQLPGLPQNIINVPSLSPE